MVELCLAVVLSLTAGWLKATFVKPSTFSPGQVTGSGSFSRSAFLTITCKIFVRSRKQYLKQHHNSIQDGIADYFIVSFSVPLNFPILPTAVVVSDFTFTRHLKDHEPELHR